MSGEGVYLIEDGDSYAVLDSAAFLEEVKVLGSEIMTAEVKDIGPIITAKVREHSSPRYALDVVVAAIQLVSGYMITDAPSWRISRLSKQLQKAVFAYRLVAGAPYAKSEKEKDHDGTHDEGRADA